ncbi:CinA family protein [Allosalinactinospora lopnorensis]|uniref:CinA family protein n=1 Tax=Allosalinactinospora lopnorensis TaxID=1352348 RepID=UPI000623FE91|nr:CinA family protein [Allosalinactinospora lopnorensis]
MTAEAAAAVHRALESRAGTVATAESLTGGLIGAALTDIAGASAIYRGGVIAYATDLKNGLLGVPRDVLDRNGAVHPEVARAMARGARERLVATFGLAVTGVAGPEPQDGRPVGTVFAAVAAPAQVVEVAEFRFQGDRGYIRRCTVDEALRLLGKVVVKNTFG